MSTEALRIALEKPDAWEYRLFAAAVTDAVNRHYRARGRHRAGIALGLGEDVTDPVHWVRRRFSDTLRMMAAVNKLVNTTLPQAFGPPGVSGNIEEIVMVAESIGQLYADALAWHNRVITANVGDDFHHLQSITARMIDDLIAQLETMGPGFSQTT